MADQITYTGGTVVIAISNGYNLIDNPIENVADEVKVQSSDFAFIRDQGKAFRRTTASGRETFTTLALAQAFIAKIVGAYGEDCVITHDLLAPTGNTITILCVGYNALYPQTNKYPGFHVDWEMRFSEPFALV